MKILIVDDEERIRSIFRKLMQREGFDVIEAANAGDAYEMVLTNQVDLILLDINMLEVDGTVLFEVVHLFCQKAKVIVTSVYPIEDQKRLIKGAEDYYDKSDSLQVLIRKVRQLMKKNMNAAQTA
jgi:two-component system OmpR family response regulator